MRNRSFHILAVIALLSVPLFLFAKQKKAERSPDKVKSASASTRTKPAVTRISDIPDMVLRDSVKEFADAIVAEDAPGSGTLSVRVSSAICLKARSVYGFLERHVLRYGPASAERVRPLVTQYFKKSLDRVNLLQGSGPGDEDILRQIRTRLADEHRVLASDERIEKVMKIPGFSSNTPARP